MRYLPALKATLGVNLRPFATFPSIE